MAFLNNWLTACRVMLYCFAIMVMLYPWWVSLTISNRRSCCFWVCSEIIFGVPLMILFYPTLIRFATVLLIYLMLKTVFKNRTELINQLILFKKYRSYLEIGASKMVNFFGVDCEHKVSVEAYDRGCEYDYLMSSDEFFKINTETFDIIFVDGSHLAEQVEVDINNSLMVLNEGGCLVLDDTNPANEFMAGDSYNENNPCYPYWDGTVWKAIFKLRKTRDDLVFRSYNEEPYVLGDGSLLVTGLTVITRGKGKLLQLNNEYYSYPIFAENRNLILNTY